MKFLLTFAMAAVLAVAPMASAGTIEDLKTLKKNDVRNSVAVLRVAANVADAETITVGTTVFEVDTAADPGAVTAGNVRVNCSSGVTPTIFTTQFETAVNAVNVLGFRAKAIKISNSEVLLWAPGVYTGATTETLAGANNVFSNATFDGGEAEPAILRSVQVDARVANATEAALETMHFHFPFTPLAAVVQVRTTAGAMKAFDGAVTITAGRVTVASSGVTDVAATDIVTVVVSN